LKSPPLLAISNRTTGCRIPLGMPNTGSYLGLIHKRALFLVGLFNKRAHTFPEPISRCHLTSHHRRCRMHRFVESNESWYRVELMVNFGYPISHLPPGMPNSRPCNNFEISINLYHVCQWQCWITAWIVSKNKSNRFEFIKNRGHLSLSLSHTHTHTHTHTHIHTHTHTHTHTSHHVCHSRSRTYGLTVNLKLW